MERAPTSAKRSRYELRHAGRASSGVALLLLAGTLVAGIDVRIEGLSGDEEDNVQAFLGIYQEREKKDLLDSRVERLHERAPDEIRESLAPFGHYRVQVDAELTRGAEGDWVARYKVDPGPVVPLGTVDVQITGEAANEPGRPDLGVKSGKPLSHAEYEAAKAKLKAFARDRGYLDARFERSAVEVDVEAYRADVVLHLDSGPRYYFGEVRFDQDQFDPDFLRRFIDLQAGQTFRDADLLRLQGGLINTDYFSLVEVHPRVDRVSSDRQVPIDVKLVPNPPNRYRFGAGFGTDTGPRMSVDWTRRYIGREGHSANVELVLSTAIQRLEAGYRIPLADPRKEYVAFRTSAERYDTDSRKGAVFSVRGEHNTFYGDWQRILALDYEYESPQDTDEGTYYNLIPGATWVWKTLDDAIYTKSGARVDLRVIGAYEGLLSSSTFLQGYARGKAVHSPMDDLRLIVRGEFGASAADSVLDIPPSRRFYAGGDNSVRGYQYEELSPVDSEGKKTGGRYLTTASVEVERRVTGDWFAAAFYDVGNAFDEPGEMDLKQAVGVGARWLSPVGLVRLDIAKGLDPQADDFRIHLVIGPDL